MASLSIVEKLRIAIGTVTDSYTDNTYSREAKRSFLIETLPRFGAMLFITAVSGYLTILSGLHTRIPENQLLGILLTVQFFTYFAVLWYDVSGDRRKMIGLFVLLPVLNGATLAPVVARFLSQGAAMAVLAAFSGAFLVFLLAAGFVYLTEWDFRVYHTGMFGGMLFLGQVFYLESIGALYTTNGQLSIGLVGLFAGLMFIDMSNILDETYSPTAGAVTLYTRTIAVFAIILSRSRK